MQVRALKNQNRLGISEWQGDLVQGREYEVTPIELVAGKVTVKPGKTELPPLPVHVAEYLLNRNLVEVIGGGLSDELAGAESALADKEAEIEALRAEMSAAKAELEAVRSVSAPPIKQKAVTHGEAQRSTQG